MKGKTRSLDRKPIGTQISCLLEPIELPETKFVVSKTLPELIQDLKKSLELARKSLGLKEKQTSDSFLFDNLLVPDIRKEAIDTRLVAKAHLVAAERFLDYVIAISDGDFLSFSNSINQLIFDANEVMRHLRDHLEAGIDLLIDGSDSRSPPTFRNFRNAQKIFQGCLNRKCFLGYSECVDSVLINLRKSIEIKFHAILGVHSIAYKDQGFLHQVPLPSNFYSKFLKRNLDLFEFAHDDFSRIVTVYDWTNVYLHNPVFPEVYKTYFAVRYTAPFFIPEDDGVSRSVPLFGTVKMKDEDGIFRRFHEYVDAWFRKKAKKDGLVKPIEYEILPMRAESIVGGNDTK